MLKRSTENKGTMKYLIILGLAIPLFTVSCSNSEYSDPLSGTFQARDQKLSVKAFVRRMEGDPVADVKARVKQGDYRYLGVARSASNYLYIPGVSTQREWRKRKDVAWEEMVDKGSYIEITNDYMARFNKAMEVRRKGVVLDDSGWGLKGQS